MPIDFSSLFGPPRRSVLDFSSIFGPPAFDEDAFQSWYRDRAMRLDLDPNPDAPEHQYDYRAAFSAGVEPDPESLHWPSDFKTLDHPNRFVDGQDTIPEDRARALKLAQLEQARLGGAAQYQSITNAWEPEPTMFGVPTGPLGTAVADTAGDIGRSITGIGTGIESGVGGLLQATGEQPMVPDFLAGFGEWLGNRARRTQELISDQGEARAPSISRNVAQGVITSAPQMALAGGVSTPVALGIFGAQAGGQEYSEARAAGASPEAAGTSALTSGAAEAFFEKFGFGRLAKRLTGEIAAAGTVKDGVKALIADVFSNYGEEAATDITQRIGKAFTYADNQFGPGWLRQNLEAGLAGAAQAGGVHVTTAIPQAIQQGREQRQALDTAKLNQAFAQGVRPEMSGGFGPEAFAGLNAEFQRQREAKAAEQANFVKAGTAEPANIRLMRDLADLGIKEPAPGQRLGTILGELGINEREVAASAARARAEKKRLSESPFTRLAQITAQAGVQEPSPTRRLEALVADLGLTMPADRPTIHGYGEPLAAGAASLGSGRGHGSLLEFPDAGTESGRGGDVTGVPEILHADERTAPGEAHPSSRAPRPTGPVYRGQRAGETLATAGRQTEGRVRGVYVTAGRDVAQGYASRHPNGEVVTYEIDGEISPFSEEIQYSNEELTAIHPETAKIVAKIAAKSPTGKVSGAAFAAAFAARFHSSRASQPEQAAATIEAAKAFSKALKAAGYDSSHEILFGEDGREVDSWAIFDPSRLRRVDQPAPPAAEVGKKWQPAAGAAPDERIVERAHTREPKKRWVNGEWVWKREGEWTGKAHGGDSVGFNRNGKEFHDAGEMWSVGPSPKGGSKVVLATGVQSTEAEGYFFEQVDDQEAAATAAEPITPVKDRVTRKFKGVTDTKTYEVEFSNGWRVQAKFFDYLATKNRNAQTRWKPVGEGGSRFVVLEDVKTGEVLGGVRVSSEAETAAAEREPGADDAFDVPEEVGAGDTPFSVGSVRTEGHGSEVEQGPKWAEGEASRPKWFALALPELVELSRRVGGERPSIKKRLREGVLGLFDPSRGGIKALAELAKNPQQLAQTIRHEIGHMIDWADEKTLARGGVLGRLAKLKKMFESVIPLDPQGGPVAPISKDERKDLAKRARAAHPASKYGPGGAPARRRDIANTHQKLMNEAVARRGGLRKNQAREEMEAVSRVMRPDLWKADPKSKTGLYVRNSKELYADFFSLLVTNPEQFARIAPASSRAWEAYLHRAPEAAAVLGDLMSTASQGKGAVMEERLGIRRENQEQAAQKRILQLATPTEEESLKQTALKNIVDRNIAVYQMVAETTKKLGKAAAEKAKGAVRAVEEMVLSNSAIAAMYESTYRGLIKPMRDAGIDMADVSDIAFLRRAAGERNVLANPMGYDEEAANEALLHLREKIGNEKFTKIEAGLRNWWKNVREPLLRQMDQERAMAPAWMQKALDNPEYVRFQVEEYIEEASQRGEGWAKLFKSQIGTFENIGDPIIETMLTDAMMIRLMGRNKAARRVVEAAAQLGKATKAEQRFSGHGMEPVPPKDNSLGLITYLEDGKTVGYVVPKDLAEMFDRDPEWVGRQNRALSKALVNPFFKFIYVVGNLAFAARNLPRDAQTFIKNAPGVTPLNLVMSYAKAAKELAVPVIRGALTGETTYSPMELELRARKAILSPGKMVSAAFDMSDIPSDFDTAAELLFARSGYSEKAHKMLVEKPLKRFFDRLVNIATTPSEATERWGKVAGGHFMKSVHPQMSGEEQAYYVRNLIGTANSYRRGLAYGMLNNFSLFANQGIQSLRASGEAVKASPLGYTVKALGMAGIPALVGAAAAAGLFDDDEEKKRGEPQVSDILKKQHSGSRARTITVPVGMTKDGRGVSFRIPLDHTGILLHGIFYRAFTAMFDKEIRESEASGLPTKTLMDLTSILPMMDPAPLVKAGTILGEYAIGRNPSDPFRGGDILTQREADARDWPAFKKVLKSAWNNVAGPLMTFEGDDIRSVRGEIKEILGFNVGEDTPFLDRFLTVSDAGDREREATIDKQERQVKARQYGDLDRSLAELMVADEKLRPHDAARALKLRGIPLGPQYLSRFNRIHDKLYPPRKQAGALQ
jgi:hypothetical protein